MALKRFNGNPEYYHKTLEHTHEVDDDDIIPFTHGPGTQDDEDGKIKFSEAKKYFTASLDAAKQDKELSSAITVDGTTETTVEDALGAINTLAGTNKINITALGTDKANKTSAVGSFTLSIDSSTYVMTLQAKDVNGDNLGQAQTIDLPLETMVVSGSYDAQNKKIILTLKNSQTVEFSVADLVEGLQSQFTYDTLPANPSLGDKVLYTGTTSGSLVKGHLYEYRQFVTKCGQAEYDGDTLYFDENGNFITQPGGTITSTTQMPKAWTEDDDLYDLCVADEDTSRVISLLETSNGNFYYTTVLFDFDNASVSDSGRIGGADGDFTRLSTVNAVTFTENKWVDVTAENRDAFIQVNYGNVENKSAATIISEITNSDVMSALAPTSGDAGKYLKADGTFDNPQATVVADQTMDPTSTNAVANAAVCAAIDDVKTLLGNVTGTYNASTRVLTLNIVGS